MNVITRQQGCRSPPTGTSCRLRGLLYRPRLDIDGVAYAVHVGSFAARLLGAAVWKTTALSAEETLEARCGGPLDWSYSAVYLFAQLRDFCQRFRIAVQAPQNHTGRCPSLGEGKLGVGPCASAPRGTTSGITLQWGVRVGLGLRGQWPGPISLKTPRSGGPGSCCVTDPRVRFWRNLAQYRHDYSNAQVSSRGRAGQGFRTPGPLGTFR